MHLPFAHLVIQDRATVLDHIVLLDLHQSRVWIDAHDRDMRPIAEDLVRRFIRAGGLQPGRYGLWEDNFLRAVIGFPIVIAKFWGLRNDSAILSTESFSADTLPGLSREYRASCQCHIAVARRT